MFELGKKIQALVTQSNEIIYVLFRGESRSKDNSKDVERGDPFNAGNQRRKGAIRKAWTMKNYFLGFECIEFKFVDTVQQPKAYLQQLCNYKSSYIIDAAAQNKSTKMMIAREREALCKVNKYMREIKYQNTQFKFTITMA